MRRIALVLAAHAAVLILSAGSSPAEAAPTIASTAHPYFNDRGTLAWYGDLNAAQAAGRASGKLLFIEYGRRACGNCKILVAQVLPAPAVKSRISAACVGLAADCDEPDPRVEAVFQKSMPNASLLPFVAVVSPDLEYVTGWQGGIEIAGCCAELGKIEAWRERAARRGNSTCKPVTPEPSAVPAQPTIAAKPMPAPAPRAAHPAPAPAASAPCSTPTARVGNAPPVGASPHAGPPIGGQAVALAAARELLRQADDASKAGRHADVMALDREAAGLPIRVDPLRWAAVLATSDAWAERVLSDAATAALAGRTSDAESRIATVRRDAAGRSASIDAERGARALTMRRFIDSSPVATRAKALIDARNSFRGTRWAALFAA